MEETKSAKKTKEVAGKSIGGFGLFYAALILSSKT
jgi:hypothetical protein